MTKATLQNLEDVSIKEGDKLVVVHHTMMYKKSPKKLRLEQAVELFPKEQVFYSRSKPYHQSLTESGSPLENQEGTVYVVGCLRPACVKAQTQWLADNGYQNIVHISDAISP